MARPKRYEEKELLSLIKQVAADHPEAKLTPSIMAKHTDIPRHIWRSSNYKRVQPLMDKLNSQYRIDKELKAFSFRIPNLIAEVEGAEDVNEVLTERMAIEQRLYKMADEHVTKYNEVSKELADCRKQLAEARAEVEALKEQVAACYIKSCIEPVRRKEKLKLPSEIVGTETSLTDDKLSDLINRALM